MRYLSNAQDWALVDEWLALRPDASWSAIDGFLAEAEIILIDLRERLRRLLSYWDSALAPLGGDPCRADWTRFRPLRLGREEDWSDWLAHLLETQRGSLAAELFGKDGEIVLGCKREDPTNDRERRVDLIMKWGSEKSTQVEVKVRDRNYEKTFDTAGRLERERGGSWTHFILLPESDLAAWLSVAKLQPEGSPRVVAKTWTDVAISLRRVLQKGCGDLRWQAWGYGFCGAVEQTLLRQKAVETDLDSEFGGVETLAALGLLVRMMEAAKIG
jgi:hypothetical protein